jgi:hypothetical protein
MLRPVADLTLSNLTLSSRSHASPGSNRKVCVNEAVVIFAAYEYREVKTAYDCPPSFSPVIASLAIGRTTRS